MKYLTKQGNRFLHSQGWNWVKQTLNTPGQVKVTTCLGWKLMLYWNYKIYWSIKDVAIHIRKWHRWRQVLCFFGVVHIVTNQNIQNKFGKSGETVSMRFAEVLDDLCLLAQKIVRPISTLFMFHKKLRMILDIHHILMDALVLLRKKEISNSKCDVSI